MPIYEYQCETHGIFSQLKGISSRNEDTACPSCGHATSRVVSKPSLSIMTASNRSAWERNEKSAHEPIRKKKHVCNHSCNHGNSSSSHEKYIKPSSGARPWMLGH